VSTLGQKPATQHVSTEKQSITGNGGTSYTLQQSVSQASDIEVFVNNTRQEPTVAYTASGTTLTMTGAVHASDSFYVIFQGKAIQTAGLPVDAAITASTISASQTLAVTGNTTVGGTAAITGNTTVGGTLVNTGLITASAGVAIGGTGSDNTLDDYEEGTYTPTLGGTSSDPTVTYQYQVGKYRKVGLFVIAGLYVRIAGGNYSGGSGDAMIKGLPFALGSTGNLSYGYGGFGSSWLYYGGSFSSGRNQMKLQFQPGEAAARIWQYGGTDATNMTALALSQVDDGQLIISGVVTYLTDS